jgi:DNA (cytosine-5)-methyltransferase 1
MRSVELFTGCGGLALGLARAGFHHAHMVEWDNAAVSTIRHNIALGVDHVVDWPIEQADVREIDWRMQIGAALVTGGPPCQPFSIGGKHGGDDDVRDMWPQAVRAVREVRPDMFLFENVRGLLRPKFAGYLSRVIAALSAPDPRSGLRYEVRIQQIDAANFGAAQRRHRVLISGYRSDLGAVPAEMHATHSRERLLWDQYVSGNYWTEHGMASRTDDFEASDAAFVRKLRARGVMPSLKRWVTVRDALAGLGEPDGRDNHHYQAGAKVYKGHTGSPLDRPAKALKAGDHGVPGGENMMVLDGGGVRYFTIREAARLQGLPDDYAFACSWSESMRQLGNAVPTQLAQAAGRALLEGLVAAGAAKRQAA